MKRKLNRVHVLITLLFVCIILLCFGSLDLYKTKNTVEEQKERIETLESLNEEKKNQYRLLQDEYSAVVQDNAYLEGRVEELSK